MSRRFFLTYILLFSTFVYADGPSKPGLCCMLNQGALPEGQDPKLFGLWHVEIDWFCVNKTKANAKLKQGALSLPGKFATEMRDWVFKDNGDCYDSNGNTCIWGADQGKVWVNFLFVPIRFRGTYHDNAKLEGQLFDEDCNEGCLVALQGHAEEPIPDLPAKPKPDDDFGYSQPRPLDPVLFGKVLHLHWDWSCDGKGPWSAIMFEKDGTCFIPPMRTCTWAAKDGKIRIDFVDGVHLRGEYAPDGQMRGQSQGQKCENGCWGAKPNLPPPYFPPPVQQLPPPAVKPEPFYPYVPPPPATQQLPPVYGPTIQQQASPS